MSKLHGIIYISIIIITLTITFLVCPTEKRTKDSEMICVMHETKKETENDEMKF